MTQDKNPYEPPATRSDSPLSASAKRGPSVRTGIIFCVVLTMLYWTWESVADGNIRVDLFFLYPLLLVLYLYALQRLGWFSILFILALMIANICFLSASYELFDKSLG